MANARAISESGMVTCANNYGTITKTDEATAYTSDCTNNYGTIRYLFHHGGTPKTGDLASWVYVAGIVLVAGAVVLVGIDSGKRRES